MSLDNRFLPVNLIKGEHPPDCVITRCPGEGSWLVMYWRESQLHTAIALSEDELAALVLHVVGPRRS